MNNNASDALCHTGGDDSLLLSRRNFFQSTTAAAAAASFLPTCWLLSAQPANARFVLDEETGDYIEIEEEDWQTAWKQRLDKAGSMSTEEIFQAARGAGNVALRPEGQEESAASKKRRAMSGCRDANLRSKAKAGDEKECTARVFGGEVDFMLNVL